MCPQINQKMPPPINHSQNDPMIHERREYYPEIFCHERNLSISEEIKALQKNNDQYHFIINKMQSEGY